MGGEAAPPRAAWPRCAAEAGLVAVVATVQIGGTALAAHQQDPERPLDLLGLGLLAVGAGAVLLRRRSPEGALALALVATATYWMLEFPRGPIFASLL